KSMKRVVFFVCVGMLGISCVGALFLSIYLFIEEIGPTEFRMLLGTVAAFVSLCSLIMLGFLLVSIKRRRTLFWMRGKDSAPSAIKSRVFDEAIYTLQVLSNIQTSHEPARSDTSQDEQTI